MSEAILAQILSRLGAIEKKLGVAAVSDDDGPQRAPLAVDFEACIIGGPAKALFAAAEGIPGDDGAKIVRAGRGAHPLPPPCAPPSPPPPSPLPCPRPPRRARSARSLPLRSRCWT